MATARKQRSDSAAGQISMHQSAARPLPQAPGDLDAEGKAIFYGIVQQREIAEWTLADLRHAAILTRLTRQMDDCMLAIEAEGRVAPEPSGRIRPTGEMAALSSLASAIKTYSILLGVGAAQKGLAKSEARARAQGERNLREGLYSHSGGLFA